ncbi:DELTA-actitoxin-Aeq1c-like isoform X1 [Mauremys reevesii]|uniref:DELTA-actitoxin-Aeq1c-like isoform X1 n=1 Tax=Mauremys reevesii TaxID=260615 RepID=UPI00193FC7FA|nr:DELTA-actitoxin-Aeq1c-like isoform X1 [Mauremys reevesii]XP_039365669.1 DELTA-actitoxin-Aeq1c-like isoform X1 [Mauremys reevesii]XP_039365670.1 DELTA-actitoxin-Aeq1c-like isoform X1 [Mauremys reevesii]
MSNIEDLIALMDVGRCVGIQITNNTRDVTLEYPRTYCFSGRARTDPVPQIPPGSSGSCLFVKTSYTARGSVGVLSYESDAFTLAIMFSNPFDRILYNTEFAIELFAGRKHFESMENLYHYMYSQGPLYKCESYRKVKLEVLDGQLEVTNEKIQLEMLQRRERTIRRKGRCPKSFLPFSLPMAPRTPAGQGSSIGPGEGS